MRVSVMSASGMDVDICPDKSPSQSRHISGDGSCSGENREIHLVVIQEIDSVVDQTLGKGSGMNIRARFASQQVKVETCAHYSGGLFLAETTNRNRRQTQSDRGRIGNARNIFSCPIGNRGFAGRILLQVVEVRIGGLVKFDHVLDIENLLNEAETILERGTLGVEHDALQLGKACYDG